MEYRVQGMRGRTRAEERVRDASYTQTHLDSIRADLLDNDRLALAPGTDMIGFYHNDRRAMTPAVRLILRELAGLRLVPATTGQPLTSAVAGEASSAPLAWLNALATHIRATGNRLLRLATAGRRLAALSSVKSFSYPI